MDKEFRGILDECLERIRQGQSVEDCLKAYPQQAEQLGPFLRAASILRGLNPPKPSSSTVAAARRRLLERVSGGMGKEDVVKGIFKLAHVAAITVVTLFVAGMGLVAAAGPGGLFSGGGEPDGVTFNARVVSFSSRLWFVQRDSGDYVWLWVDEARFEDASGRPLEQMSVQRDDRVFVEATADENSARTFHALLIRMVEEAEPTPTPTPPPEPTATPTATPAPEPTATPEPEPEPAPAEVFFEGWVKEIGAGSFVLKSPDGVRYTILFDGETVFTTSLAVGASVRVTAWALADGSLLARHVEVGATEFWGTVLAIGEGSLTLQTDSGTTTVWTGGATFIGTPFVGVKVWVLGYKQPDGSWNAVKVTVKTIEFMGTVQSFDGSTLVVLSDGVSKTVRTDGNTSYPAGAPSVGSTVSIKAYKMGDGTFLAYEVFVKPQVFSGVVIANLTAEWTLKVQVGAELKVVCYEFAENKDAIAAAGDLMVGKTVEVHVDHFDGSTYFASKVLY